MHLSNLNFYLSRLSNTLNMYLGISNALSLFKKGNYTRKVVFEGFNYNVFGIRVSRACGLWYSLLDGLDKVFCSKFPNWYENENTNFVIYYIGYSF